MKDVLMTEVLNVSDEMIKYFLDTKSIEFLPPAIADEMRSSFESKASVISSTRKMAEIAMLVYMSANFRAEDVTHYHQMHDYFTGVIDSIRVEREESSKVAEKKRLAKRISDVSEMVKSIEAAYELYIAHKSYNF